MVNPFLLLLRIVGAMPNTRPLPREIEQLNAARSKLAAEEKRARRRARNLRLAQGEKNG